MEQQYQETVEEQQQQQEQELKKTLSVNQFRIRDDSMLFQDKMNQLYVYQEGSDTVLLVKTRANKLEIEQLEKRSIDRNRLQLTPLLPSGLRGD